MDASPFLSGPARSPAPPQRRCMRQEWQAPPRLRAAAGDRRLPLPVPAVPAAAFLEHGGGAER